MILENTYDIDKYIKEIAQKIIIPFYSLDNKERVSINNISSIINSKYKTFLVLEKRNVDPLKPEANTVADKENKEIIITIAGKKIHLIIDDLRHELIHALDFNRADDFKSLKKRKNYNDSLDSYFADKYEFNQEINDLKSTIELINKNSQKLHPWVSRDWVKIRNIVDLANFFEKESGQKEYSEIILNNIYFRKKFLKRLSREGLLPPNFRG